MRALMSKSWCRVLYASSSLCGYIRRPSNPRPEDPPSPTLHRPTKKGAKKEVSFRAEKAVKVEKAIEAEKGVKPELSTPGTPNAPAPPPLTYPPRSDLTQPPAYKLEPRQPL